MQPTARITGFVFKEGAPQDRLSYLNAYKLDGLVDVEINGVVCHIEDDYNCPEEAHDVCITKPHVHEERCHKTSLSIPFQHYERHTPKGAEGQGINIWKWDGDRNAPTLQPSYLTWWGQDSKPDFRFHCFVTRGSLDLLSDSQVAGVPMVKV